MAPRAAAAQAVILVSAAAIVAVRAAENLVGSLTSLFAGLETISLVGVFAGLFLAVTTISLSCPRPSDASRLVPTLRSAGVGRGTVSARTSDHVQDRQVSGE